MSNRICSSSFSFSIFSICSNSYPKVTNKSLFTHTMVLKKLKSISQHYFNVLRKDYLRCIKNQRYGKGTYKSLQRFDLSCLFSTFVCQVLLFTSLPAKKEWVNIKGYLKVTQKRQFFTYNGYQQICTQMKDIQCSVYLDKFEKINMLSLLTQKTSQSS